MRTRKTCEEVLTLRPDQRRKMEFGVPRRRRRPRPDFSPDEIVEYLRSTGFRTTRELRDNRAPGDPTVYDCRKAFGGVWSDAVTAAFPSRDEDDEVREVGDAEYLVKVIVEFGFETREQWLRARKRRPSVVPSINQVRKHWGTFTNLANFAKAYSMRGMLDEYRVLWDALGRRPTMSDCWNEGVDVRRAVDFFGGKNKLDAFVRRLRAVEDAFGTRNT